MRILVCGGRDFVDWLLLRSTLDKYIRMGDTDSLIVQGGARGADKLARYWADQRGVPHIEVPALWTWHGKAAGPIRNAYMLKVAKAMAVEVCMAFPGGKGTQDMIAQATAAGLRVEEVR